MTLPKTLFSKTLLAVALALPCAAMAGGGNIGRKAPVAPSAVAVGAMEVTGQQVVSQDENCSKVVIRVTGQVTGVNDDGGGMDNVTFELWDDGQLKDSVEIQVPVGQTQQVDVTMAFAGRYLTGAAGVGVYAGEIGLNSDPFIPTDVAGTCETLPISGKVVNLKSRGLSVVCTNRSTGQRVTVTDQAAFNCSTAGLVASPGDKVQITISGRAK